MPNFSAGGIATPADAALVMQLGAEAVFVGSGIFKSADPETRAKAIVKADHALQRSARRCSKPAKNWATPCRAWTSARWPKSELLADPRLVDGMATVGVLALQGDFEAHAGALRARRRATRSKCARREELARVDGLIIPGGESTTMLKLMEYEELLEPLRAFGERKPVFGTCAGAILLAARGAEPGAGVASG